MSPQTKNFSIVLITSLLVTFSFYGKITLHSLGPGGLWFNKYVEAHRQGHLEETLIEQSDSFMSNQFSKTITTNMSAFSYEKLPGYIFYKVFNLQGEDLWLAQKLLISLLNIGSILLVFGITRCLFGEKTAVLSSILCAFSPHIWITFNFDSASIRAYNYFLSLLTVYLYLRYEEKKNISFPDQFRNSSRSKFSHLPHGVLLNSNYYCYLLLLSVCKRKTIHTELTLSLFVYHWIAHCDYSQYFSLNLFQA